MLIESEHNMAREDNEGSEKGMEVKVNVSFWEFTKRY